MRENRWFLFIIILFITAKLPAFEERIFLGREDGWNKLVLMDGLVLRPGFEGQMDLFLADGEYSPDTSRAKPVRQEAFGVFYDNPPGGFWDAPRGKLLLHFNGQDRDDPGPDYQWSPNTVLRYSQREKVLGDAALAFDHGSRPAVLFAKPGVLLGAGNVPEDFTIEFWLYPARLIDGETAFSWEGAHRSSGSILSQRISCRVEKQRLSWSFDNFFLPVLGGETQYVLQGNEKLLPRQWRHHLVRYESTTGILEYLVDGVPEALVYTTPTHKENSEIYQPQCGTMAQARIALGENFVGMIDELRIIPSHVETPQLERYRRESGTAMSDVFDLGNQENRLTKINARYSQPDNTAVYFYFRMSPDYFLPDDRELPWRELAPGERLNTQGRFVQVLFQLLPDGTGTVSPRVSSLELVYEPQFPPLPPSYLIVRPGDAAVSLQWDPVEESDQTEFLIYFGDKPGHYFGTSGAGNSPLRVSGQTTLTIDGLQNGKLYYFSVRALAKTAGGREGLLSDFSREASARPSPLYRTKE